MKGIIRNYLTATAASILFSTAATAVTMTCQPKSENPDHDGYVIKIDMETGKGQLYHDDHKDDLKVVEIFGSERGDVYDFQGKHATKNDTFDFYYFEDETNGTLSILERKKKINIFYKCEETAAR